uniref:Auxin-responsive protein n=1 Tax=Oryza punctata TaxID=4537 RepID=A0A0E0JH99_ORYPU
MEECKGGGLSPSSSMDSSTHPALSTTSPACRPAAAARRDLTTDLRLGLSLSTSSSSSLLQAAAAAADDSIPSTPRNNQVHDDWPPIKPFLRSALQKASAGSGGARRRRTLFVKVYMEGVPIGRKLDLLLLDGYDSLLIKLCHMFKTPITYADVMECHQQVPGHKAAHVLTYEDQDGDWMMVGDVPWELFLSSVKKLRIARMDKC